MVGKLRAEAEPNSFVDISNLLAAQLPTPLVQHDPGLKLWCLVSKGYTGIEINVPACKQDWEEAQVLAEKLGERRWIARANGELGLVAYLEGNDRKALYLMGKAFFAVKMDGDVAAEIRYLGLLGNGFNEMKVWSRGLWFFKQAIGLDSSTKDIGFPFMAYEGKAMALAGMGRNAEAKAVIRQALNEAGVDNRPGHET